jgi:hypothetical protein
MRLSGLLVVGLLMSVSSFSQAIGLAFYNESQKCGVIYQADEAFYRFDVLSGETSKKYTGVRALPDEEGPVAGDFFSHRDSRRKDKVPLSKFIGGSPLGNSYLIVAASGNTGLYDYNRYDEAFSNRLFPKTTKLCPNMAKVNTARAQELIKKYSLNSK